MASRVHPGGILYSVSKLTRATHLLTTRCQGFLRARGCDVPRGFPDESPSFEIFTVESRTQLDQAVTDTVKPAWYVEEPQQST